MVVRTKRLPRQKLDLRTNLDYSYSIGDWSGSYQLGTPEMMGTVLPSVIYATARPVATTVQTIVRIVERIKYLCEYCSRKFEDSDGGTCEYCGAPLTVIDE